MLIPLEYRPILHFKCECLDQGATVPGGKTLRVPERLGHDRQANSGFYDPEINVVFLHSAGDSRDDGTIWV